jgi:hypothetical protein
MVARSDSVQIVIQILILGDNCVPRWSLASSLLSPFIQFWNNLTALQAAAVISALVLTIGAVVEYWYKLKLLVVLALKWIFRKSTPFDRCIFNKLFIHSFGPILVVLGIAGEVVFEGRTFVVEDRQEEQARRIVGSLKKEAEQADEKAKKAIADSSTALNQVDSFEADIKVAKQQAADAESHLADAMHRAEALTAELNRLTTPRHLPHKAEIVSSLNAFKDTEYVFSSACFDEECFSLLKDIDAVLQLAGWKRAKSVGGFPAVKIYGTDEVVVPESLIPGIMISVDAPKPSSTLNLRIEQMPQYVRAAVTLNMVLATNVSPLENTKRKVDIEEGTSTVIRVTVGRKP